MNFRVTETVTLYSLSYQIDVWSHRLDTLADLCANNGGYGVHSGTRNWGLDAATGVGTAALL